ncbi:MAG: RNA polymerase sigma factor [Myxococcales bacterium]|nr:RNA polymerase sigma factor [Myxococcales bacterium]
MSGRLQRASGLRLVSGAQAPGTVEVAALTVDEALDAHLHALYGAARMLTGERSAAEDLVQETALRAFAAWGQLRSRGSAKAWLMRTLHRQFLNSRRTASRRPAVVDVDLDELVMDADPTRELTPPGAADLSDEVGAALDAMPHGFREAVWLLDVEELTLAEAAEVLELPVGTVASRAHRGRKLLRARLLAAGRSGP